jgi:hypothetical protein
VDQHVCQNNDLIQHKEIDALCAALLVTLREAPKIPFRVFLFLIHEICVILAFLLLASP